MSLIKRVGEILDRITSFPKLKVIEVNGLSDQFRLIRLQGPGLKKAKWHPGDKLQILMGLTPRTYTPLFVDREKGQTEFLAYRHSAESVAGRWLEDVKSGMSFTSFGPNRSLAINDMKGGLIFFGDETSLGVAHTLKIAKGKTTSLKIYLELRDPVGAKPALRYLGLDDAVIVAPADDAERSKLTSDWVASMTNDPHLKLVLTGNAASIQKIRTDLRESKISMGRLFVKAYWAIGKRGID